MEFSRRKMLAMGGGTLALAGLTGLSGMPAWAATGEEAVQAFTGGAEVTEGGVDLTAPEIAENGNTVPVEVEAPGAVAIALFAMGNPNAEVCTATFGPLAGASFFGTRIRLAKTQDVVAVARMADGSFRMAKQTVKVTIGGCGG